MFMNKTVREIWSRENTCNAIGFDGDVGMMDTTKTVDSDAFKQNNKLNQQTFNFLIYKSFPLVLIPL